MDSRLGGGGRTRRRTSTCEAQSVRYSREEALWWEEGSELPPLVAAPSGKGSDLTCSAKGCL